MFVVLTGEAPVTLRGSVRRQKTLRWLAAASKEHTSEFYVTTPDDLQIYSSGRCRFTGWYWNEGAGKWNQVNVVALAPVLIDLMYLNDLKKHRRAYQLLKRTMQKSRVPYFNPALPGKDELYGWLKQGAAAPVCLPRTRVVRHVRDVYKYLDRYGCVWLKPVHGSGGRNMVRIRRTDDELHLVEGDAFFGRTIKETMSRKELSAFVRRVLGRRKYIVQENVPLPETTDGRKLDIRVTVQRDLSGLWTVTATTLRKSAPKATATNYHAGGERLSLDSPDSQEWLKSANISPADIRNAQAAAIEAARVLQAKEPTLGVLGVDVAPHGDCCYVYDCNSRPGRDILTNDEVQVWTYKVAGFAHYLETRKLYHRL